MLRPLAVFLLIATLLPASGRAAIPGVEDRELLEDRPFDVVVLARSQGGAAHKVLPLRFPGRRVPQPQPSGWLKVRLLSQPGAEFEVAWSDVNRVALFEQMLLERALELTGQDDFDRAFDFFARLHRDYADLPALPRATERFLTKNAEAAFRGREYDKAIALMLAINDQYPNSPTLGRAVDAVAGKLIEARVAQRDFRGARAQLDIVEREFDNFELTIVDKWRARFRQAADSKAGEAARHFREGDFRAARSSISQAVSVWPTHEESLRLLAEIDRVFPQVIVGVTTASLPLDETGHASRLDAPAALRTAPLTGPTVTRLVGYSGEGGVYDTPLGEIVFDDTGRNLAFAVNGDQAPYTLARWLVHTADPGRPSWRPALADVVASVRVDAPDLVVVSLSRSHFRPEALVKDATLAAAGVDPPVRCDVIQRDAARLVVELSAGDGKTSFTVEEEVFATDEDAIAALGAGRIDLVANVPPWRLAALREARDLVVERYRLPTVHGLIPTGRSPLLDEREFRRAIVYGLNRERILNEVLLGNEPEEGYRVVSGPFPYGISLADPVRYGYNDAVSPRPFEPRLSVILANVAWSKVQAAERESDGPASSEPDSREPPDEPLPPLTLAHSTDPFARTACQAIKLQLEPLGFNLELVELTEAELLADDPDFDLRYAELALWEPAVDAATLLGPGGLAGRCSDPMRAALRRLSEARNTKQVQRALFEVHRLANGDLPFLPLWQTAKHFAYRDTLAGVPSSPVGLYTTAASWRKRPPEVKRPAF